MDAGFKAFIRDYCSIKGVDQRRAFLERYLGRPPLEEEWHETEKVRVVSTGMTSGEIAELIEFSLTPAQIRHLSERGEMPTPVRGNRWWFWDRAEIEAWWTQRQGKGVNSSEGANDDTRDA